MLTYGECDGGGETLYLKAPTRIRYVGKAEGVNNLDAVDDYAVMVSRCGWAVGS